MEIHYTSYTRKIDNCIYYFVKKYLIFPELQHVPPIQEKFGMHRDFEKACDIAEVEDSSIRMRLREEANNTMIQAKVIDLNSSITVSAKAAGDYL